VKTPSNGHPGPARPRALARVTAIAAAGSLLITGVAGPAFGSAPVEVRSSPQRPTSANAIDLLKPAGELLSGRPWLLTEGLDPSLLRRPGSDPLTRLDWEQLQGQPSPITQAAGGGALVPYRDPGPAFSRNLLVTRDFGTVPYQTEPHLAVDPNDPERLVLGVIDYSFPSMSSYVSFDGGERWEGPNQVPFLVEDRVAGGDPVLGIDRAGNTYMGFISIGVEEFNLGTVTVFSQVSSIAVAQSPNGISWAEPISTARSRVDTEGLEPDRFGRLRGTISTGFLDKPWLAIGPSPDDPERDVIYVTYTDFDVRYEIAYIGEIPITNPVELQTTIRLVSSQDGGRTWTEPVDVSPTVRQAYGEREAPETPGIFGTNRTVQGSQPAVAPDGMVHVAWIDSTDDEAMKGVAEIQVARSTDGGQTFSTPLAASVFNEIDFRPRNAFFRYWASAFPQLAVGPEGELHIAYVGRPPDRPGDDGDVYLVSSLDEGETWTRPRRLNDDDGNSLQFFPSLDVDPNGSVHVMWGDMRDDPVGARYHIYYTRSDDQGETWGFEQEDIGLRTGDTRVSDFGSNANRGFTFGLFLGDYFSLKATDEDVYMVWADTRLAEFGGTNQKIAFARRSAVISPELFISPPAGPGGQEVTLQGFDFQPNVFVYVQLGDQTIATMRTDDDGQFTSRLYIPITSEGAQTITAFDETGNGATTSYFTEFGFGSIQDLIEDLGRRLDAEQETVTSDGS
jgi:hypothetical protein